MLAYLSAEVRHRLARTLGSLAGVASGVALFVALVAAGNGFVSAARQPLADISADIVISRPDTNADGASQTTRGVREPFGLAPIAESEVAGLRSLAGVADADGGLLLWDFSASSYQTVLGVATDGLSSTDSGQGVSGGSITGPGGMADSVTSGRFLTDGDSGVVVVDQHYAAFFGLKPGATVEIGGVEFAVVGVVSAEGGKQSTLANFYLPIADAQELAGLEPGQVNQVYLRVGEAVAVEQVITEAESQLGPVTATTEQSIVSVVGGITEISDRFARVAALVALVGGLLLTAVTLNAAIGLRVTEVGLMKATGWRARDVVRLFTVEGLGLSAAGAAIGVVAGWLLTVAFSRITIDAPALLGQAPDLDEVAPAGATVIDAGLSLWPVLLAALAAVGVGGVTAYVSALRVARRKPAEALRS